jgi:uncharacterized protein (TIGR02453 family)
MASRHPIDEDIYPPFTGFPKAGLDFFRKLKKNNKREWFLKHKEDYEELAKFPMQCLIATLRQTMVSSAPEIEFNPKRSIFRIYRDVRFSKNKTPYKTNIAASFQVRGRKGSTENPGLYLHVSPGEVFLGGGLYMPAGDQIKRIRQSIAGQPKDFLKVINDRKFTKHFGGLMGEKLKKAPLGFPADHPMIEHLRHKQFFVYKEYPESVSRTVRFARMVANDFALMMPLIRWLSKTA